MQCQLAARGSIVAQKRPNLDDWAIVLIGRRQPFDMERWGRRDRLNQAMLGRAIRQESFSSSLSGSSLSAWSRVGHSLCYSSRGAQVVQAYNYLAHRCSISHHYHGRRTCPCPPLLCPSLQPSRLYAIPINPQHKIEITSRHIFRREPRCRQSETP